MSQQTANCIESKNYTAAQEQLAVAFRLLYRAMYLIEDLTALRAPALRQQVEIEKFTKELIKLNAPHE
jgi:hypothetical protein